jgi:cytochrome c oxidase subunit 3
MAATLLVIAAVAGIALFWLSRQRVMSKPWLEQGPVVAGLPHPAEPRMPAAKVGLGVFIAVASALMALFVSAYLMRMHMAHDWRRLPDPPLLWLNTAVLALGSLALHRALMAARRGEGRTARRSLHFAGGSAILFLAGQSLAWWQLVASGHFLAANPANAFFYLITAVHGAHLAGGLVGLGRVIARARRGGDARRLALGIELCALYWHFLLLAWLVLFGLLLLT